MTKNFQVSWRIQKPNQALQDIFAAKLGISKVVAQILVNRGINTLDEARMFLFGETEQTHDPFLMKDMEKAVGRIRLAISQSEKIRVFGDYDVDGVTATSLLMRVLKRMGARVDYYIPERLTEGYGLNAEAVTAAMVDGVSLIITVDSGVAAVNEVELANSLHLDVIITDHHEPPAAVPKGLALLNPKQHDCSYPFKELAGVGVAYKLGIALIGEEDPINTDLIELACLGTVADIVPLQGENRILVKNGLKVMRCSKSPGLRALMQQCGIVTGEITSRQVAFQMSPKINAAGRLGDASIAVRMLLSESDEEGAVLAAELCALNEKRQAVEAEIYKEALSSIESGDVNLEQDKIIVLAREGWHLGVIGIVASKLVQEFCRPVVLLGIEGEIGKGSARSIPSFNIFEAFKHQERLLTRFGGHKQAAGLTLPKENIAEFAAELNRYADNLIQAADLIPEIYIDTLVDFGGLDESLYRQLQMLAPYGHANPDPVLACQDAYVLDHRLVGAKGSHLKLKVGNRNIVHDAIGFNLGERKGLVAGCDRLDMVFALEKNEWNGRTSLQLRIRDLKPSELRPASAEATSGAGELSVGESFIDDLFINAISSLTDDPYRDIARRDEFYTKVAGVTFAGRQEVAAGLAEGERLSLVREMQNPHDPNAVRVETSSGAQLGYLNARLAKHFAPLLDRGEPYLARVSQVTGGQEQNFGVNVIIGKVRAEHGADYQLRLGAVREELAGLPDGDLMDRIRQALLGVHPYREKQAEVIDLVMQGNNSLAVFGTGRGKSAVFQSAAAYKAIRQKEITVVVYPLRALVNDQYENMSRRLQTLGLRVYKGNGSISDQERAFLFTALQEDGLDILLTTPEFVVHHMGKLKGLNKKIGLFVVDESHHIGMASITHRPIYKRLGEVATALGHPTVLAVTATANNDVADEIIATLNISRVVIDQHIRNNLHLIDKRDISDKKGYIKQVIAEGAKTIVYVNSRLQAVELAAMLREELPQMSSKVAFYHAGLNSEQRNNVERLFREGDLTAVISTSAFGEGIDIPDIKNVILYHINFNQTEFNQQCGRCGRDGRGADIHLLCGRRDAAINKFILDASSPDRDTLAVLYKNIREMAAQLHPIQATNDDLAKLLKQAGIKYARPSLVSAGLGILEELELISREVIGRNRTVELMPSPEAKLNIDSSLRYVEGQEEKLAFRDFEDYFFASSADELLRLINRPIYPEKYATAVYASQ